MKNQLIKAGFEKSEKGFPGNDSHSCLYKKVENGYIVFYPFCNDQVYDLAIYDKNKKSVAFVIDILGTINPGPERIEHFINQLTYDR